MEDEKDVTAIGTCDHSELKGPFTLKLEPFADGSGDRLYVMVCEVCGVLISQDKV